MALEGGHIRVPPPRLTGQEITAPDTAWASVLSRFVHGNRFQLGGSGISLYDFENKVIRPIGDPRVHFALNCRARGCPRLPREPFRADLLDPELEACAQYFFSEDRNVKLEPATKTVRLSQILQLTRTISSRKRRPSSPT